MNFMQNRLMQKIIALVALMILSHCALGQNTVRYFKFWDNTVIIGSLSENKKWKYYLEPNIRLIARRKKFDEGLIYAGFGYQFTPNAIFFLGDAWITTQTLQARYMRENRVWQQILWNALTSPRLNLIVRLRLEERKDISQPRWAMRWRQRLMFRIPFGTESRYSLVLFDEMFFNLNHPSWVSNRVLEQNRAFIGIGTRISKYSNLDVGYLNQTRFAATGQINHVLLISFAMNY